MSILSTHRTTDTRATATHTASPASAPHHRLSRTARGIIVRFVAALCSVVAVFSFSACSVKTGGAGTNAQNAADSTEYKYGTIEIPFDGSLCGSPIAIAKQLGYFAEEGIDVQLVTADAETRKVGLDSGRFPITNGDFQFFPSIEEGVSASVVGVMHKGCIKIAVKKGSDIKTAADLKGKKIGVDQIGGTPYMAANMWLGNAGLNVDETNGDVTYLPYDDSSLEFQALQDGEIDAAALWDPLPSVEEQKGTVDIIFDLGTDPTFAAHFCCFLYASNKVLDENPEEIKAILRAINKARTYITENPDEAASVITENNYSSITDTTLASQLMQSYDYAVQDNETALVKSDAEYFSSQLKTIGFLKTDDPISLADNTIYRELDID